MPRYAENITGDTEFLLYQGLCGLRLMNSFCGIVLWARNTVVFSTVLQLTNGLTDGINSICSLRCSNMDAPWIPSVRKEQDYECMMPEGVFFPIALNLKPCQVGLNTFKRDTGRVTMSKIPVQIFL